MRDLLLLAAVGAICVYGYFMMDRLDRFLALRASPHQSEGERLYIGLSQPLAANGLTALLEQYSAKKPAVSIGLYTGTNAELAEKLSWGELDLIFLSEGIEKLSSAHYDSRRFRLHCAPVVTSRGGLPIVPTAEKDVTQYAFWKKPIVSPCLRDFLTLLPVGQEGDK